jgi:hypothetical protein
MAQILQFKGNKMSNINIEDTAIKSIIEELLSSINSIKDIMIFIKDKNDGHILLCSDVDITDKSLFLAMLQQEVFTDLTSTSEIIFEPEA